MRIESVKFIRSKGGPEETGILVAEGDGPLIDLKGKIVGEIWNYRVDHRHVITVEEEK